jgi:hypothetical protein
MKPIPSLYAAMVPTGVFTDAELATRRLTEVDGKRTDYQGYGTFTVPVRGGKTVVITMQKLSAETGPVSRFGRICPLCRKSRI